MGTIRLCCFLSITTVPSWSSTALFRHMGVPCGPRLTYQMFSSYDHHMRLLGVSIFLVSLVSFAAENPPRTEGLGTAPVMSGSSLNRDHAFVVKDEVVLVQTNQKLVIPLKSIAEI